MKGHPQTRAALAGWEGSEGAAGTAPGSWRGKGRSPRRPRTCPAPAEQKARGGAGRHRQLPPQTPPTARPASPILPRRPPPSPPAGPYPPLPEGSPPYDSAARSPLLNRVSSACNQPTGGTPATPVLGAVSSPEFAPSGTQPRGTWDPGTPPYVVCPMRRGFAGCVGGNRCGHVGKVSPRGIEWNPEEEGGTPAGGTRDGEQNGVRVGYTLGGPHRALGTLVTQADPASENTPTAGGRWRGRQT